jgi:hypothetical protein
MWWLFVWNGYLRIRRSEDQKIRRSEDQKIRLPNPHVTANPPTKKKMVATRLGQFRLAMPVIAWPEVHPPA